MVPDGPGGGVPGPGGGGEGGLALGGGVPGAGRGHDAGGPGAEARAKRLEITAVVVDVVHPEPFLSLATRHGQERNNFSFLVAKRNSNNSCCLSVCPTVIHSVPVVTRPNNNTDQLCQELTSVTVT